MTRTPVTSVRTAARARKTAPATVRWRTLRTSLSTTVRAWDVRLTSRAPCGLVAPGRPSISRPEPPADHQAVLRSNAGLTTRFPVVLAAATSGSAIASPPTTPIAATIAVHRRDPECGATRRSLGVRLRDLRCVTNRLQNVMGQHSRSLHVFMPLLTGDTAGRCDAGARSHLMSDLPHPPSMRYSSPRKHPASGSFDDPRRRRGAGTRWWPGSSPDGRRPHIVTPASDRRFGGPRAIPGPARTACCSRGFVQVVGAGPSRDTRSPAPHGTTTTPPPSPPARPNPLGSHRDP